MKFDMHVKYILRIEITWNLIIRFSKYVAILIF